MRLFLTVIFPLLYISQAFTQVIENPNFAMASHPMRITKFEQLPAGSLIELSIENQSLTGSFCADKDIFVQDVLSGIKIQMISSKGIPVCPAKYRFKEVGETLVFQLYFPKINTSFKYLTLVENCNNYCFSIAGIILDQDFNTEIDLGYEYYEAGKLDFALAAFKQAIENHPKYPFGFLYLNIIQVNMEKGDTESAKKWYTKLNNSNFKDKQQVLDRIKQQSYYSQLIF